MCSPNCVEMVPDTCDFATVFAAFSRWRPRLNRESQRKVTSAGPGESCPKKNCGTVVVNENVPEHPRLTENAENHVCCRDCATAVFFFHFNTVCTDRGAKSAERKQRKYLSKYQPLLTRSSTNMLLNLLALTWQRSAASSLSRCCSVQPGPANLGSGKHQSGGRFSNLVHRKKVNCRRAPLLQSGPALAENPALNRKATEVERESDSYRLLPDVG